MISIKLPFHVKPSR